MFLSPTTSKSPSALLRRQAESYCARVGGRSIQIEIHHGMDLGFNPTMEVNEQRG